MLPLEPNCALLVVDLQHGFDDPESWGGGRSNPACEANVGRLLGAWRDAGRPVVLVRHDSTEPGSPLAPGTPGNELRPEVAARDGDLMVAKSVNSCFYGTPDLDAWLRERQIRQLAICGMTTNHCCETTARMAGNLGYDVLFVLDATATFDRRGPDGAVVAAADLERATAASLHGEFARVVSTVDVV
jgi:nicotinamidase-related amidase